MLAGHACSWPGMSLRSPRVCWPACMAIVHSHLSEAQNELDRGLSLAAVEDTCLFLLSTRRVSARRRHGNRFPNLLNADIEQTTSMWGQIFTYTFCPLSFYSACPGYPASTGVVKTAPAQFLRATRRTSADAGCQSQTKLCHAVNAWHSMPAACSTCARETPGPPGPRARVRTRDVCLPVSFSLRTR